MTCDDFERILVDSISGKASETSMLRAFRTPLVLAHVRNCPACAGKMREASRLEEALDDLRLSARHLEAPAGVEKNLLDAFDRERARRHSSNRPLLAWRPAWLSAAAVVLLIAGVLFFSRLGPLLLTGSQTYGNELEIRPRQAPGLSGTAIGVFNNQPAGTGGNPMSASKTRVSEARKPERGTVDLRASATQNYELSLNGGSSVVRVTLPMSSLTAIGLPVHADLSDPRVTADVWIDPFGDVTRVRLVAENLGPNQQ
jgi:hypothetical protein